MLVITVLKIWSRCWEKGEFGAFQGAQVAPSERVWSVSPDRQVARTVGALNAVLNRLRSGRQRVRLETDVAADALYRRLGVVL